MKIGTSLQVIVGNIGSFRCKVIDKNAQGFFIDYPAEWKERILNYAPDCTIYYIENNIPQIFQATFKKHVQLDVSAFLLSIPAFEEIEPIQRREYVRVDMNVDMAIHFKEGGLNPVVTVSRDISGGGARIIVPPNVQFKANQIIELYMVLSSEETDFEYIFTEAEVIRSFTEYGIHSISVKFLLASESDRQHIIRFCFATEREIRKQGIL